MQSVRDALHLMVNGRLLTICPKTDLVASHGNLQMEFILLAEEVQSFSPTPPPTQVQDLVFPTIHGTQRVLKSFGPNTYFSRYACGIKLVDKIVMTGGRSNGAQGLVQVYNVLGLVEQLPNLRTPRYSHGCGHYIKDDKIVSKSCPNFFTSIIVLFVFVQVFLVTGGSFDDNLSSTEVLVEGGSEWIFSDPLPSPRSDLNGASLNNRIVVAGDVHIAQNIKILL